MIFTFHTHFIVVCVQLVEKREATRCCEKSDTFIDPFLPLHTIRSTEKEMQTQSQHGHRTVTTQKKSLHRPRRRRHRSLSATSPSSVTIIVSSPPTTRRRASLGTHTSSSSSSSSSLSPPPLERKRYKRSHKSRSTSSSSSGSKSTYVMGFAPMSIAKRRLARRSKPSPRKPSRKSIGGAPSEPSYTIGLKHVPISTIVVRHPKRSKNSSASSDDERKYFTGFAPMSIAKRRMNRIIHIPSMKSSNKQARKRSTSTRRQNRGGNKSSTTHHTLHKTLLKSQFEGKLASRPRVQSYFKERHRVAPSVPRKHGKRDYSEFPTSPTKHRLPTTKRYETHDTHHHHYRSTFESTSPTKKHTIRRRDDQHHSVSTKPFSRITVRAKRAPLSTYQKNRRQQQEYSEPSSPTKYR